MSLAESISNMCCYNVKTKRYKMLITNVKSMLNRYSFGVTSLIDRH